MTTTEPPRKTEVTFEVEITWDTFVLPFSSQFMYVSMKYFIILFIYKILSKDILLNQLNAIHTHILHF